jgi:hypothetical protein
MRLVQLVDRRAEQLSDPRQIVAESTDLIAKLDVL